MTLFDTSLDRGSPRAEGLTGKLAPGGKYLLAILVVILGIGFGLQYATARMMGVAGVEPIGALLVVHGVVLLLFGAALTLDGKLFWPSLRHLGFFVTIAAFCNIGQLGIELMAAHHVAASDLTLIVSLLPIFVLMLAALLGTERLTGRKISGIALGVAASTAILLPQSQVASANLFWLSFTFLAPLLQAIGMVLMAKFWPKDLEPLQVATGALAAGTLMLGPAAAITGASLDFTAVPVAGGLAMAGFALSIAIEFSVLAVLTRRGGAVLASCADFVAVFTGLGFGFLLFGEVPGLWMVAAALFCLVALKLASAPAP